MNKMRAVITDVQFWVPMIVLFFGFALLVLIQ
jgi:hypothetical protein